MRNALLKRDSIYTELTLTVPCIVWGNVFLEHVYSFQRLRVKTCRGTYYTVRPLLFPAHIYCTVLLSIHLVQPVRSSMSQFKVN